MQLNPLTVETRNQIQELCKQAYPQEACGIVTSSGEVVAGKNVALNPTQNFELKVDPELLDEAQCVWHSHTNSNPELSVPDILQCKALGIPFYLYALPMGREDYLDPNEEAPYLGRPYRYGHWDCYSLIRDIYQRDLGIHLNDYPRKELAEWNDEGWNMYSPENFAREGFVKLEQPTPTQKYDFICMMFRSSHINHVGILMEPEANIFYQHLYGRLSEKSVYGGHWAKITTSVFRHKELM